MIEIIPEKHYTFTQKGLISFAKWCENSLKEHSKIESDNSFAIEENIDEWLKETENG